jgi:hypothetical protein
VGELRGERKRESDEGGMLVPPTRRNHAGGSEDTCIRCLST